MAISDKIKQLRIENKWTQAELAERLSVRQKQISAYETGANNPSTDVLIRLSEVFDVSLDYLAFELQGKSSKISVKDRELLKRFEAIDNFSEDERRIAREMLDLVIMKHRFQNIIDSPI
jgi:transcriptional regulator with XRE-family HTH domain